MKNVKLFKTNEGLLSVDLLDDSLEEKLLSWLEENHWEMWADLEMWEGGVACLNDFGDDSFQSHFQETMVSGRWKRLK